MHDHFALVSGEAPWRTVAVLVGCSPGSQPAQKCEGSPAVVVVAYHKPFEHLNRLAVDYSNQITHSTLERRQGLARTRIN